MNNLDWLDAIARPEQLCPNMPQHCPNTSGRLEAPEYAMPQLPQHAPTQKSMKGQENKEESAPGEVGGQETISAAKTGLMLQSAGDDLPGLPSPDTQNQGYECTICKRLTMTLNQPEQTRRRQFLWACTAGFKPLAIGYGSERVLIAPDGCDQWQAWPG